MKRDGLKNFINRCPVKAGDIFGRLTVLGVYYRFNNHTKVNNSWAKCMCACGRIHEVSSRNLYIGNTKSCGCLKKDIQSKRFSNMNYKHGWGGTKVYQMWKNMMKRCYNKKSKDYHLYGGRGITVYKSWHDPDVFCRYAIENGYVDGLTIERKCVNSSYVPENVCFVSFKEQYTNKNNTIKVKWRGEEKPLTLWSKDLCINYNTLMARLKIMNWTVERAFTTRPKKVGRSIELKKEKEMQ